MESRGLKGLRPALEVDPTGPDVWQAAIGLEKRITVSGIGSLAFGEP